jgi:V/A-type H+-transporting ATPase subunit E
MGLENLVKDIQSRGENEVERIRREGKEEAERLLRDANAKRKSLIERSQTEALKAAVRLKVQESSRVELENRRAHLVMEKEMLDLTIAKARHRLAGLSPEKDKDILRRLLVKHGPKAPVIISNKKNEAVARSLAPSLKYGGTIDCLGGLVLQTVDGSVRYDLRYETLLELAAQASMKQVVKALFQG